MMNRKRIPRISLTLAILVSSFFFVKAHISPNKYKKRSGETYTNSRVSDCLPGKEEEQLDINNIRARLRIGGDIWWDGENGKYIAPRIEPGSGVREVSSIFAGGVWLGGQQLGGDIYVAASAFGSDFYPGPLYDERSSRVPGNPGRGETNQETCENWDKFFIVRGEEIDQFISSFRSMGDDFDCSNIPLGILGWPGKGNPYFFDIHGFELPDNNAGLAGFRDVGPPPTGDGIYNPCDGDYPIIEIRNCPDTTYADEMIFWIYNDNGGEHTESNGDAIRMEVQAQSFAFKTSDQINDMTFYRYKMINRAIEPIDSFHFSMWIDPDLGCSDDDYIGCDTTESLMYVYNADPVDGISGTDCPVNGQNVPTYGTEVPILGVDYFEGPTDENGNEIGMSSFMYYNRQGSGPPGTSDPTRPEEFYSYMTGTWPSGRPLTVGGDGNQNTGIPTRYAFFDPPNKTGGWSMCEENVPIGGDRRTLQTSGPFRLDPGTNNFLIIGVVWVPDYDYPCPSLDRLLEADAVAQNLFDACFELTDGPDAPDIDIIELDRQLILVLTNDENSSNNYRESYQERDLRAPSGVEDSLYRFEGYTVYQTFNELRGDLSDPDYARIIANFDISNGVTTLYNWEVLENPNSDESEFIYVPVLQVEGGDSGIRRTVNVTKDLFATGDNDFLINNRDYYFIAVAYAHNEYKQFTVNPIEGEERGQRFPYLRGRRNIGDSNGGDAPYIGTPRPILEVSMNAFYGEGTNVQMLSGIGISDRFVDITDATRLKMAEGTFDGVISYNPGEAPIEVFVYNPLDVVDGDFELRFLDTNGNDEVDDQDRWELENLNTGDIFPSTNAIGGFYEQIFRDLGISIGLNNALDFDDIEDRNKGIKRPVGSEIEYKNENAQPWFGAVTNNILETLQERDIIFPTFFSESLDFVATEVGELDAEYDPGNVMNKIGNGEFVPFQITNFRTKDGDEQLSYVTPNWTNTGLAIPSFIRGQTNTAKYSFASVPNVDIVMTSDRGLWSKCIVVEGASSMYINEGWESEHRQRNWAIRDEPSLLKEVDINGRPQYDPMERGFSWFPGYAVNIETGDRLNIFFSENSVYNADNAWVVDTNIFRLTGDDMIWNPTTDLIYPPTDGAVENLGIFNIAAGCQHNIYVTDTPYDECASIAELLSTVPSPSNIKALEMVQWTSMPLINPATPLLSYADGLIPEELTVKLRVNNPFGKQDLGNGINNDFPVFRFNIEGKEASELNDMGVSRALENIRAVPNPYYAYSDYEVNELSNIIKITNLPAKCEVTIYSLDGKFIRKYNRNESRNQTDKDAGIPETQYVPDIEWDLKNHQGIPVASGVYLIHIKAPDLGEKVIKWFGIGRQFDASGL